MLTEKAFLQLLVAEIGLNAQAHVSLFDHILLVCCVDFPHFTRHQVKIAVVDLDGPRELRRLDVNQAQRMYCPMFKGYSVN